MIRRGGSHDVRFLRDLLRHAYYWRARDTEFPITRYVNAWGRRGDRALIAIDEFHAVGAAWYRLYSEQEPGFGFVDEETPELSIAVVPSRRGRGIGEELLRGLLERARAAGFPAISLGVEQENAAIRLYERFGFRPVREEGDTLVMRADAGPPE